MMCRRMDLINKQRAWDLTKWRRSRCISVLSGGGQDDCGANGMEKMEHGSRKGLEGCDELSLGIAPTDVDNVEANS